MEYEKTVTGIGSVPFDNVKQALEYSLSHPIPFLPELTTKGETMMEYIKSPGILQCLKDFKVETRRRKLTTVKVQSIGPATLAHAHVVTRGREGYTDTESVRRVKQHVNRILEGLIADEIILFLDEPSLEHAEKIPYVAMWHEIFEKLPPNVTRGIHSCGNANWERVFRASYLDIVSYDASMYNITRTENYPAFRQRGRLAHGIAKIGDAKDYRCRLFFGKSYDLITPPCGISHLSPNAAHCKEDLRELIKIAEKLQRRRFR